VAKTTVVCVEFLPNVACQKLSKATHAAQSYSKNKSGTFYGPRCIYHSARQHLSVHHIGCINGYTASFNALLWPIHTYNANATQLTSQVEFSCIGIVDVNWPLMLVTFCRRYTPFTQSSKHRANMKHA